MGVNLNNKNELVNTFVSLNTFKERCAWLSSIVRELYGAQKVLLFFHSERRSRYIIRKAIGIQKYAIDQFDSCREPFIYYTGDKKIFESYCGTVSLENWSWFHGDLKTKLATAGLTRIVPLWSGFECLGGLIFSEPAGDCSRKTQAFGAAGADFANLLEIAFVKELLKRETWEKEVLLEVGRKISQLDDLDSILNLIIDSIMDVIDYDAAAIFLLTLPEKTLEQSASRGFSKELKEFVPLKVGKGLVGWAIEHNEEINVPDVRKDKRYIMARKGTRSEVVVPITFGNTVMGAFALESDKVLHFRYHDVELLRAFAVQTAIVLENSKLFYKVLEASQLRKELEIARNFQQALLPNIMPEKEGYDFAAVNHTSLAIGGDLFDFIKISDHQLGIAIGDISGKGVPGALMMTALNSTFRGLTRQSDAPDEVVRLLNKEIYEHTESNQFATFFYGILDFSADVLWSTNAGHNPPILYRAAGEAYTLKKGGPLIGVVPDFSYRSEEVVLQPGDILFLFTDGVSEVQNDRNEEFGEHNIIRNLEKYAALSAEEIIQNILSKIQVFSRKKHQDDDLTMVVIKKL